MRNGGRARREKSPNARPCIFLKQRKRSHHRSNASEFEWIVAFCSEQSGTCEGLSPCKRQKRTWENTVFILFCFMCETQFVPKTQTNCGSQEKGTAGLHIFWHRAGWLVLLLLCQSSSSFILQRPLGHEDRCQMQDTNLYNTVKCVFHALCLHFSHSSKDSRALDWNDLAFYF